MHAARSVPQFTSTFAGAGVIDNDSEKDLAVSNVIDGSTSADLHAMAAVGGASALESAASRIREFTGKRGRGPHRLSSAEVRKMAASWLLSSHL